MQASDLASVARIEARIFAFPWTVGNFSDSLAAGYDAWIFEERSGEVLNLATEVGGLHQPGTGIAFVLDLAGVVGLAPPVAGA